MKIRISIGITSLIIGLSILGCSTNKTHQQQEIAKEARQLKQHNALAYTTENHYAISSSTATLTLSNEVVELSILQPVSQGNFPLIIYVPGLGESANDGMAWRKYWAEAGYVVLSFQFPADGPGIYSTSAARDGDFRVLAREHFSDSALKRRLALTKDVFGQILKHRNAGGADKLYSQIDFNQIALVGSDLGTQLFFALANTELAKDNQFPLREGIRCLIALSPHADFESQAFERQYGNIRLPVLSVTSDGDVDNFGLVSTPSLRKAPFQFMPPGDKYLISLIDAPHDLIAGKEHPSTVDHSIAHEPSAEPTNDTLPSEEPRKGKRRGGGPPNARRLPSFQAQGSPKWDSDIWIGQIHVIQQASTAFIDAYLKNDAAAQDWLRHDVNRWLADIGGFTLK